MCFVYRMYGLNVGAPGMTYLTAKFSLKSTQALWDYFEKHVSMIYLFQQQNVVKIYSPWRLGH